MTDFQSLIFYLVIICISCLFASVAQRNRVYAYYKFNSTKNSLIYFVFLVLSMIPLVIVAGFREFVGTDYSSYVYGYNRVIQSSFIDEIGNVEIGHVILVKFSEFLFHDPFGLFLFSSIITILFLYLAVHRHRYTVSISLALMLYYAKYYAFTLNGVRQGIAMSIVLFSFKYIVERNFKKYTMIVLLASLFHTTALVMLPFYFIMGRQTNSKLHIKLLYLVISLIIVIFISEFFVLLTSFGPFSDYSNYVNLTSEGNFSLISIIVPITVLVLAFILRKHLIKKEPMTELYMWLYLYGFIFSLIGIKFDFVNRISLYFDIVSIILIPLLVIIFKSKPIRLVGYFLLLLYCIVVFIMGNYINDGHDIIPYKFIWE